jgi:hypothetical protein
VASPHQNRHRFPTVLNEKGKDGGVLSAEVALTLDSVGSGEQAGIVVAMAAVGRKY